MLTALWLPQWMPTRCPGGAEDSTANTAVCHRAAQVPRCLEPCINSPQMTNVPAEHGSLENDTVPINMCHKKNTQINKKYHPCWEVFNDNIFPKLLTTRLLVHIPWPGFYTQQFIPILPYLHFYFLCNCLHQDQFLLCNFYFKTDSVAWFSCNFCLLGTLAVSCCNLLTIII